MTDFTMCASLTCAKRLKCQRHICSLDYNNPDLDDKWQSVADLTPKAGEECGYYVPITEKKEETN